METTGEIEYREMSNANRHRSRFYEYLANVKTLHIGPHLSPFFNCYIFTFFLLAELMRTLNAH